MDEAWQEVMAAQTVAALAPARGQYLESLQPVVNLVQKAKTLLDMLRADQVTQRVLDYWEPIVMEALSQTALATRAFQHGDLNKATGLVPMHADLRQKFTDLKRQCLLPADTPWVLPVAPAEYTTMFELALRLMKTLIESIDLLKNDVERTEDHVVVIVQSTRAMLEHYTNNTTLLEAFMPDNKKDVLLQLSSMVQTAKRVIASPDVVANREELLRLIRALGETTADWIAERFDLSLLSLLADLRQRVDKALLDMHARANFASINGTSSPISPGSSMSSVTGSPSVASPAVASPPFPAFGTHASAPGTPTSPLSLSQLSLSALPPPPLPLVSSSGSSSSLSFSPLASVDSLTPPKPIRSPAPPSPLSTSPLPPSPLSSVESFTPPLPLRGPAPPPPTNMSARGPAPPPPIMTASAPRPINTPSLSSPSLAVPLALLSRGNSSPVFSRISTEFSTSPTTHSPLSLQSSSPMSPSSPSSFVEPSSGDEPSSPRSPSAVVKDARQHKLYSSTTLRKWRAQFFAVAILETPETSHGELALKYETGQLIAVYDEDPSGVWGGVNVETEMTGFFPQFHVEVIQESRNLLAISPPDPTETWRAPEALTAFHQVTAEERERIRNELRIRAPPPERSGELRIRHNGKWLMTHVVLKDAKLYFSTKSKGTMAPIIVPLKGCLVSPVEADDVAKDFSETAFKVTKRGENSKSYIFTSHSKQERGAWVKVLTMAALNIRNEEMNTTTYDYGSAPKSRLTLSGFDSEGNVFDAAKEEEEEQRRLAALAASRKASGTMGSIKNILFKRPSTFL